MSPKFILSVLGHIGWCQFPGILSQTVGQRLVCVFGYFLGTEIPGAEWRGNDQAEPPWALPPQRGRRERDPHHQAWHSPRRPRLTRGPRANPALSFRALKTPPGCVPFLPCRKVFKHLTTFLSVARSLRGRQGAPPRLHLKIKVVLTTLLEQQILSGYKKSSFSPKVLNSNHMRPGKVHAGLFSLTGPA